MIHVEREVVQTMPDVVWIITTTRSRKYVHVLDTVITPECTIKWSTEMLAEEYDDER